MARFFGRSVKRLEDPRLLTGGGSYLDDIKLPDLLEAEFVRSQYPHARIKRIDFSKLKEEDGFVAAIDANDLQFVKPFPIPRELEAPIPEILPLARNKTRFLGEPLALIIARNRYIAEDLASLVDVEYEPLEPVVDVEKSLDQSAPRLYEDWESNLLKGWQFKAATSVTALQRQIR